MSTPDDQLGNEKMPYVLGLLIGIDQLGNAIADGNPDNTISARVGYFASDECESKIKGYWKFLEMVVDFAFKPIQGPGHCFNAWQSEKDEPDYPGNYIARIILGIFVLAGCILIIIFLWLAVLIYPPWRFKPGDRSYATWRKTRREMTRRRMNLREI